MQNCKISPYQISATARYPRIRINGKKVAHSRVVYCAHNNIPLETIEGLVIRHKCDNPACINPEHLELGTQKDNVQDSVARGRAIRSPGEANGRSKLTPEQVLTIRSSTEVGTILAERHGVSSTVIYQIKSRKLWAHL